VEGHFNFTCVRIHVQLTTKLEESQPKCKAFRYYAALCANRDAIRLPSLHGLH